MTRNNLGGVIDKAKSRVTVVYRKLSDLKLAPGNPRIHSPKQVEQIAESIGAFGFVVPILVDRNLQVIAGHGRVLAAQRLGLREVPTIALEHLTEAQAKTFMIADNRLTENSAWDDHLLAVQLHELAALDLDFSLEVTGFDMGEIDFRIEGLSAQSRPDDADDLRVVPAGALVTKTGDLWVLGEHRIACASALDPETYESLFEGKRAAVVFTDPPYNVRIDGNVSGRGAVHHREFAMASGEMSEAEFTDFLTRTLALHARYTAQGSLHFVFIDWRHLRELLTAGRQVYAELKNVCVWVKNNGGMGSMYRSQYELVFVFKHGRTPHRNNVMLGVHGRNRSNVWNYPSANSFSRSGEQSGLIKVHPTVKPCQLACDAILDSSSRRDIVLDGFLGSGTTVIAAERTGRRCFGIEIDPRFVDFIVRRWQRFTGGKARHATTNRTFNELELEQTEHDNAAE